MPMQAPLESRSHRTALAYVQGVYSSALDRWQRVTTADSTSGASLAWLSDEDQWLPHSYDVIRVELPKRWELGPTGSDFEIPIAYSGWPRLLTIPGSAEVSHPVDRLSDLTRAAEALLPAIGSARQREQAAQFIADLHQAVSSHGFLFTRPLSAIIGEDGALLLEWVFLDRRLLFVILEDSAESSWSFVSEVRGRPRNAWGLLTDLDLNQVVTWIAA